MASERASENGRSPPHSRAVSLDRFLFVPTSSCRRGDGAESVSVGRALGVAFCFHADARLDWPARAPTHTQGEAGVAFNRIVVSFLSVRSAGSGNADVDIGDAARSRSDVGHGYHAVGFGCFFFYWRLLLPTGADFGRREIVCRSTHSPHLPTACACRRQ